MRDRKVGKGFMALDNIRRRAHDASQALWCSLEPEPGDSLVRVACLEEDLVVGDQYLQSWALLGEEV